MDTLSILLIEDDPLINRAWSIGLNQSGYRVISSTSIASAKVLLKGQSFDAAIIDINLQDGNGIDLLRWLKSENISIKTLCVTARQDEETALLALQKGATEFIRKPIGPKELATRLDRIFKYTKEEPVQSIYFKDFTLIEESKEVFCLGKALKLSPSEYKIFYLLLKRAQNPVSREQFLEVLDLSSDASDRTIDSHISRIRKKLKELADAYVIESVWGNGYSLKTKSTAEGESS